MVWGQGSDFIALPVDGPVVPESFGEEFFIY